MSHRSSQQSGVCSWQTAPWHASGLLRLPLPGTAPLLLGLPLGDTRVGAELPPECPHPMAWALRAGLPLPQSSLSPRPSQQGLSPGPLCPRVSRSPNPTHTLASAGSAWKPPDRGFPCRWGRGSWSQEVCAPPEPPPLPGSSPRGAGWTWARGSHCAQSLPPGPPLPLGLGAHTSALQASRVPGELPARAAGQPG